MSTNLPFPCDRAELERFVSALFRYATDGAYVSLRGFDQVDRSKAPLFIRGIVLGGAGLPVVVDAAAAGAADCAMATAPAVFAPPVCVFHSPTSARSADVAAGLTLSAEMDEHPDASRLKLCSILGHPTVGTRSGSIWADPQTGELQRKGHHHWRLSEAAEGAEALAMLQEARQLMAQLCGSDRTGVPVAHPYRWPGSWNLKDPTNPVLSTIVEYNPDTELHLADALDKLRAAAEAEGLASVHLAPPTDAGAPGVPQANPVALASAMAASANDDASYAAWIARGYACWHAWGGSARGFDAWDAWSQKSGKYNANETLAAWARICSSQRGPAPPPRTAGAGTIFFHARQVGWVRPEPFGIPSADVDGDGEQGEQSDEEQGNQTRKTDASVNQPPPKPAKEKAPPKPKPAEHKVAQAFVVEHGERLRYCHETGRWYAWNGYIWAEDRTELAFDLARGTSVRTPDADPVSVGSARFIGAVERLSRADRAVSVAVNVFDRDPWLLATPGGTVDLRTGLLGPARPTDLITKCTSVTPADTADCPHFLAFLEQATMGDREVMEYLQRWGGYCLTGITTEQCLLFLYGPGKNGKGVLLNLLNAIFGGYSVVASLDTFTASTFGSKHPADLAMLRGARLVLATETEEGRSWEEAKIKAVTGGDPITARFMCKDFFTYVPEFKITMSGNHKPVLRNVDAAARRRVDLATFLFVPTVVDKELPARLLGEAAGILRWLIEGCLKWQQSGLMRPRVVTAATDEYFADQDQLGQWVAECCDEADYLGDAQGVLFASWSAWAEARGEPARSMRWFAPAMERRGYRRDKDCGLFRGRGFVGVRVKPTVETRSHFHVVD